MAEFFGQLAEREMARGIFRIEQRHALVAGQGFDAALLLEVKTGRGGELLDRF